MVEFDENMVVSQSHEEQQSESFTNYFECWISEQDHDLQELRSASQARSNHPQQQFLTSSSSSQSLPLTSTQEEEQEAEKDTKGICDLIERVVHHYEAYYQLKKRWVKQDVFTMLSTTWRSSLEQGFLWISGWRPSMAFHLLYSKSGLHLQAQFDDIIIRGLTMGDDLADISASQLKSTDELQRKTIREEREITEKMAEHQETVADSSMVELSHMVTELMMSNGADLLNQDDDVLERVKSTLAPKKDGLEKIVERADDLRLRTLKGVIDILTPIQAVGFLIAAAELHLRVHDWGKQRDNEDRSETHHQQLSQSPTAASAGGGGH